MGSKSTWEASAQAYWQPSDYILAEVGGVGYEGRTNFTGSMLSIGGSYLQLDLGFKPHWWSPLYDSSMLMSTEAPTMPSVSISNYEPFTPLGMRYEFFDARMSKSDHIAFEKPDGTFIDKTGNPLLFGAHVSIEPVSGWSFGVSRLLQYGGAGRPESLTALFKGFFNPPGADNIGADAEFQQPVRQSAGRGHRAASFFPARCPSSSMRTTPVKIPRTAKHYLLGNSALSVGIHFPRIFERFDLTCRDLRMAERMVYPQPVPGRNDQ